MARTNRLMWVGVVLCVSGCGAAATVTTAGGTGAVPAGVAGPVPLQNPAALSVGTGAATPGSHAATGGTLPLGGAPGQQLARSVIASYIIPDGHFLQDFQAVVDHAAGLGGYVESSSTTPNGRGRIVSGSITVQIPVAKLSQFLGAFSGSEFSASGINFSTVNDSSQYVDLNAQLQADQSHLAALEKLVASATSVSDVITIENQVDSVTAAVNTDLSQLNQIETAVDYAMATLQLSERNAAVVPHLTQAPSDLARLGQAIERGFGNAVTVVAAALVGLVTLLPLWILALLLTLSRRWWWPRLVAVRDSAKPAPSAAVAPPS